MNTQLQQGLQLALLHHLPVGVEVDSTVVFNDVVRAEVLEVKLVKGARVGVVGVVNGTVNDLLAVLRVGRVDLVVNQVVKHVLDVKVVVEPALVAAVGRSNVQVVVLVNLVSSGPVVAVPVVDVNQNVDQSSGVSRRLAK